MALSEDEIKTHRLVVNAIKSHVGAAVLTASTIAKMTGLDEKEVRRSIACLRGAGFFSRQTGLIWETPTSVLKLRKGIVLKSEDANSE